MKRPDMTPHAKVRYLERVLKIKVDEMINALLTPDISAAVAAGASKVPIGNKHYLFCKDGKIISVLPKGRRHAHRRKTQRQYDPEDDDINIKPLEVYVCE